MNRPTSNSTIATDSETAEPVTLTRLRAHCNVVADDEDDLLRGWLTAARKMVERDTGLLLVRQTVRHRLPCWPDDRAIVLPIYPLISVASIEYLDADEQSQTLESEGNWYVDTDRRPGVIWKRPSAEWPDLAIERSDAVTITAQAGYSVNDSAKKPPEEAQQAIQLIVGHWYRNREAAVIGTINSELELGYERLIDSLSEKRYPG